MYLDYWQLDAKPFEPHCDAPFLFAASAHQAALHKLRYAVENRRAAALVAGPAGVGKTLLVESLAPRARRQPVSRSCDVVFPQMTDRDLLVVPGRARSARSPADPPRHTIEESLRRLEFMLQRKRRAASGTPSSSSTKRICSRTAGSGAAAAVAQSDRRRQPALHAAAGRPAGAAREWSPATAALDERIDIKVFLPALTADETAAYVEHRLAAAGASREIFSAEALTTVHQLTGGMPRRINRLCDLALLVGYANGDHCDRAGRPACRPRRAGCRCTGRGGVTRAAWS